MFYDIELSIVIPVYNESEILIYLYERLKKVLEQIDNINYEIIFIDDGSTDDSFKILEKLNKTDNKIRIISLSRNFGHQVAITAGLNFSSGKAVVIMDADLQDPPELIIEFIKSWQKGFDVVYGIRTKRKENIFKRLFYSIYYKLLKKLSYIDVPLNSGDFCLLDRKVVDLLNKMPERTRFIRGMRSWIGFKQTGIIYERDKRYKGRSKYTFFRLIKLGLDGIISFSGVPLRFALVTGFFISFLCILYTIFIVINRIIHPQIQIPGWTSIAVGITFLGSIQLIVLGFIGEYIIRIYDEVKGRPLYVIEKLIGFNKNVTGLHNNSCL